MNTMEKPPYKVPSMDEINALPWNGYNVVSTFSGCGGSCLGYRMAGYRVLWASEFIPEAAATYKANHPSSILDTRDIRTVQPEDILSAIGLRAGELDLLDGSPPCSSFSMAGKRQKNWGKEKTYSDTNQRTDDLFFEFARLLKGIQPKVFLAENVAGLVRGSAKGYFLEILAALKACGYVVTARLLDAQWLGTPQHRERLIFQGVRADLAEKAPPCFPTPLSYRYSVRDALPHIRAFEQAGPGFTPEWKSADHPSCTISAEGNFSKKQSPFMLVEADSDISRYAIGREWLNLKPGEQSEKYFQLVRADPEKPCPTITVAASWAPSAAASVTHPFEQRKFSIAELKRICGFPDDFILTGSYSQQWERCGRAVPPVMAAAYSAAVRDGVLAKIGSKKE